MKFLRRRFCQWFCVLIAARQLTASAADSSWSRVVVIGASASAGFTLSEPFGGPNTEKCKLHHHLDAAIIAPHAPVKSFASGLFFLSPDAMAAQQTEAVTNQQPTLVVATDFLFWFCYGEGDTDAERAAHFEAGLRALEKIRCPLLVGDIPDASSATNSGIISVDQVPSETARLAANARLKKWAAKKPNVILVPLAEFMRATKANAQIKIHDTVLPAGTTRALLQPDGLHPNVRGAKVLSLGILDALVKSQKKFPAKDVRWTVADILKPKPDATR